MNKNTSVLVVSCDAYFDLWNPFFDLFFKYWIDCPYKVYLSSNFLDFKRNGVISLKSELKSDWSSELKIILNKIQEDNIILILEDYFILKDVNQQQLNQIIGNFHKLNAVFFRLGTFPKMYKEVFLEKQLANIPGYVVLQKNCAYRVNLQVALWQKEYLRNLLKPGESPWQFEIEASKRSDVGNELFLGLESTETRNIITGPISYYGGAITKGIWMRKGISIAKKNGIVLDLSHRKIESYYQHYRRRIYTSLPIFVRKIIDKSLSIISVRNS